MINNSRRNIIKLGLDFLEEVLVSTIAHGEKMKMEKIHPPCDFCIISSPLFSFPYILFKNYSSPTPFCGNFSSSLLKTGWRGVGKLSLFLWRYTKFLCSRWHFERFYCFWPWSILFFVKTFQTRTCHIFMTK